MERRGHGASRAAARHRRRRAHLHLRLGSVAVSRWGSTTSSAATARRGGGDQIYFQGHASPGIYARAFLEGRLTERPARRVPPGALPPRRRPAVLPASAADAGLLGVPDRLDGPRRRSTRSTRPGSTATCTHRGINDTSRQRVWAFLGDGEMDEPESLGAIGVAAREELDNLTFVINCNLQRLDGPVRGNGKIIQELEAYFRGAGWNVIKVIWGRRVGPAAGRRHRRRAGQPDERHTRRRLPDLQGRVRRVRPGALLRPRPAHRGHGRSTCPTTRSGTSSAAGTTTASCTPPTRPRRSTPASRP